MKKYRFVLMACLTVLTILSSVKINHAYLLNNSLTKTEIETNQNYLHNQEIVVQNNCDSAYPDTCIPSAPPNLNCKDLNIHNFKVIPPDPHNFDRDSDGIGCEG